MFIKCAGIPVILLALGALNLGAQTVSASYRIDRDLTVQDLGEGLYVVTHAYPWPANAMYIRCGETEALLIDTPYTPEATAAMLSWFETRVGKRQLTAINTGFHFDNLGGNAELKKRGIPVWGADRTPELIDRYGERSRELFFSWLASEKDQRFIHTYRTLAYEKPDRLFRLKDGLSLTVGGKKVEVFFPGETHTADNTVVYLPDFKLLFGGCMLLAGTGIGNTQDANLSEWLPSVEKLRKFDCRFVIPGHGTDFSPAVLENTISVLKKR